jgi:hypothetical protein
MRAALLALLVMGGIAVAQPVRLVVTSDSCEQLAGKLNSIGTFVDDARASVRVVESDHTATVTIDDGDGHIAGPRVIHADSCEELAGSVAVVISMSLPAIAALPEPQPLPKSDAMRVVIAAVKLKEPVPQAHDAEIAGGVEIERPGDVKYSATASMGIASAVGMNIAAGIRVRWDDSSIAAEIAVTPPQEIVASHVSIERASIALAPCHHFGDVGACAVVRVGLDRGVGTGLMDARTAVVPLAELGPRLTWEHRLTDLFSVQLDAEVDLALTTTQFDIDHVAVWRTNRFAGLAGAGVVLRFL